MYDPQKARKCKRIAMISSVLHRFLSEMFMRGFRCIDPSRFVVCDVIMSPDLRKAKVVLITSGLVDDEQVVVEDTICALNNDRELLTYINRKLFEYMSGALRRCPKLTFVSGMK